jgi:hypothetical protein
MGTETAADPAKEPTIEELKLQIATLEHANKELDTSVFLLQQRLDEFASAGEIEAACELYADPANWTAEGKFAPVATWIDVSDPYLPARRALDFYNK